MFQFTGCPLPILWIQMGVTELFIPPGYPIRKSGDQRLRAAPPGVSPLTASFIGLLPQGIHRAPFVASNRRQRTNRQVKTRPIVAGPLSHQFIVLDPLTTKRQITADRHGINPTRVQSQLARKSDARSLAPLSRCACAVNIPSRNVDLHLPPEQSCRRARSELPDRRRDRQDNGKTYQTSCLPDGSGLYFHNMRLLMY
jgi:hypothetical protein